MGWRTCRGNVELNGYLTMNFKSQISKTFQFIKHWKGGREMKIYYSKEPIEIGNATGDPIPADSTIETLFPTERVFYSKPTVEEVDFRSGKEKRRERRKQERNRKRLLK